MENPDKVKGNISKLVREAGKDYLLKVDISYPNDSHNLHNDLLLMCEKMKINRDLKAGSQSIQQEEVHDPYHGSGSSSQTGVGLG